MNPIAVLAGGAALGAVVALSRRALAAKTLPGLTITPRAPAAPVPGYARGDPQSVCDPTPKPGTLQLRDYVLANYGGRSGGIYRACGVGGRSEHKEGRAWDWFPPDKAAGDLLVGDLLAENIDGVPHAGARRWGLQYLIWYRRLWSASKAARDGAGPDSGWKPYTRTGSATIEHRDHIHFTQSRAAAAALQDV